MKMDDLCGFPPIFGNTHIWSNCFRDLTRPISPQKVAFWKGNGTPYFKVGEIS